MSENVDLTCDVCLEAYLAASSPTTVDKRPMVFCKNGHTFCADCCSQCSTCPQCREPKLAAPIVNIALVNSVCNDLLLGTSEM